VVGPDGLLPLPWLAAPLHAALATQRSHALLVQGPRGVGQFELSLALAQGWLCETPSPPRPCGQCAACKLVQAHSHPDLLVLLPEALREPLGWTMASEDESASAASSDKSSKRKPSKDIRIDEVRLAVAFAQTTSARGRGKVIVLHPVERMNMASANALLKTLEEPAGSARLVLSTSAPQALLPTIRSRCQAVPLQLPEADMATQWLAAQSVLQPDVLLAAAGGQPQEALQWAGEGVDAATWLALPRQLARAETGALATWPLPRVIDMLQKLCHDLLRQAVGSQPRYFPAAALVSGAPLGKLNRWSLALQAQVHHAEHPWNVALMVDALVAQARTAMAAETGPAPRVSARSVSVH
jgi:DNA polymerase III subunit delta'